MADVPVLKLNVGGTPVHVRRSTLENSGVPALAALCNFEDRFIDRPLVPFEFVLGLQLYPFQHYLVLMATQNLL